MPGELFMRLYSYGTELNKDSKEDTPVPFEKMAEIDLLITTCRESARTVQEKLIVARAQGFWDVCFRKWHDNLKDFEEKPSEIKRETKAQSPGRFEKVGIFAVLIRNIRTLKSGNGLAKTTSDDFQQLMKLIEHCASVATTSTEKKVIKDAVDTYDTQFKKWQGLRDGKLPEDKEDKKPKKEFELSEVDKLILAGHHRAVARKMRKDNK